MRRIKLNPKAPLKGLERLMAFFGYHRHPYKVPLGNSDTTPDTHSITELTSRHCSSLARITLEAETRNATYNRELEAMEEAHRIRVGFLRNTIRDLESQLDVRQNSLLG